MAPVELGEQLEISLRLLVAVVLGSTIGFEREIHAHPAGMRTHLLVSLGSAVFTVLSIFFFEAAAGPNGVVPTDPSRVAAQIVSGIGFLGAGAILKYGSSVRGLTTAASLWATAGVGMAAGSGAWVVAALATVLIVFSLGPLNWLVTKYQIRQQDLFRLRVVTSDLDALAGISKALAGRKVEIASVRSQRVDRARFEMEIDLRPPAGTKQEDIIAAVTAVPDVEILEAAAPSE